MLMVCYLISWLLMLTTNFCMSAVVYTRYRKGHYKVL